MKHIKKINEYSNGQNIVITLPKKILWKQYEKELQDVKSGDKVLNFKVSNFPKNTKVGNKCYLVHDSSVVGWMNIVGFEEKEFKCETTGKKWKGKFIQRSGTFHKIDPIKMKGFQGFRYYSS